MKSPVESAREFLSPEWIKVYKWWQIILPKLFGVPVFDIKGNHVGAYYKGVFYWWSKIEARDE